MQLLFCSFVRCMVVMVWHDTSSKSPCVSKCWVWSATFVHYAAVVVWPLCNFLYISSCMASWWRILAFGLASNSDMQGSLSCQCVMILRTYNGHVSNTHSFCQCEVIARPDLHPQSALPQAILQNAHARLSRPLFNTSSCIQLCLSKWHICQC